ncbi:MAG: helicase-related protein [Paludibacteraceae bacterium]
MTNILIDNSDTFRLVDYLNRFIAEPKCNEICIATGYWDLKGTKLLYDALLPFFERGGKLRLLIGQEPIIRSYQLQTEDMPKSEKFPDFYIQRDINLLTDDYAPVAQMLLQYTRLDDMPNSQIQIKVYGQKGAEKKFLHAKCYIFLGNGIGYGIIGSSNFTEKGLQDNAELNYLEVSSNAVTGAITEYNHHKTHLTWFNQMWEDESCENWTGEFIKEILSKAPIAQRATLKPELQSQRLTPYETYIRLLQDRFAALTNQNMEQELRSYLPKHFNPLKYQLDAVQLCYRIMHQHGGFLLGDVVGLGKTIVGVLLIKYYLECAADEGRTRKVLIIVPPAIRSAWERTIAQFDEERVDKIAQYIDFITTGSIDKVLENAEDMEESTGEFNEELKKEMYSLIIIDESHNFRNNGTIMYNMLNDLIEQVHTKEGYYPYIGLLSATLQNNSPEDLKNQIYLFERTPKESTISVNGEVGYNLDLFFQDKCKRYNEIIHANPRGETAKAVNRAALIFLSKEIHDRVLSEILVRRTRSDIKEEYKEDLHFPDIVGPNKLDYKLNPRLARLFYKTMNLIEPTEEMKMHDDDYILFMRYRATEYLLNNLQDRYTGKNMTPQKSSSRLARIMQMLLVKRLESSFTAFRESLENLQRYTQNMITMWEKDTIFICPNLDVNYELNVKLKKEKDPTYTIERCFDDIRTKIQRLTDQGRNEKGQNAEYHRADFDPLYIERLMSDKRIIDELVEEWKQERNDPKLTKFITALTPELFNPDKNKPHKLVIFSEAIATVDELADQAASLDYRVLKITAANRESMEETIRANFDANYPKDKWRDEYDIIITTEVLAEGVNLHRANTILNYDTPWNATRLIQRIGRVNRIGSKADKVYVYNFFPSSEGDEEINLVQRAYTKLQSFHTLFGEDSKVFTSEEELSKVDYKKLIEDEKTPFTDFIAELRRYKETYPVRFAEVCNMPAPLVSVQSEENTYCVVKTTANTASSVYIQLPKAENYTAEDQRLAAMDAQFLSCLDFFKIVRCEPDTQAIPMEVDIENITNRALEAYKIFSSRQHRPLQNNKSVRQAKEAVRDLIALPILSPEAKERLKAARILANKGNVSVAKKILAIASHFLSTQQSLFELSAEDINAAINQELQNISATTIQHYGEPYLFATVKK